MEEKREGGAGNPLLKGGRRKGVYDHGFSAAQVGVLSAICEALIPPMDPDKAADHVVAEGKEVKEEQGRRKSIEDFFHASGGDAPLPDEVLNSSSSSSSSCYCYLLCCILSLEIESYIFIVLQLSVLYSIDQYISISIHQSFVLKNC